MKFRSWILFFATAVLFFGGLQAEDSKALQLHVEQARTVKYPTKAPLRIAHDNAGNLYVTAGTACICKFDSSGHFCGKIDLSGIPLALAVQNDYLYVSLRNHRQIVQMDTSGNVIRTFGSVQLASDMAIDSKEKLYVVDSKTKKILVFDFQGNKLYTFSSILFVFPTGITIDERNHHILVTEHGGIVPPDSSLPLAAVHVFDMQGNWLEYYGHYGGEDAQFARMQGLDVDALGRMFITDSYQGVIKVLDRYGNFLTIIGEYGFGEKCLAQPMDVTIDRWNRLWVTSYNTNTLLRFEIKGLPDYLDDSAPPLPRETRLLQNYPNPFNGGTVIPFVLGQKETVTINIYNAAGQRIRSERLGIRAKGVYSEKGRAYYWDGKNAAGKSVASGVYYYELRTDNYRAVRRMLLIK